MASTQRRIITPEHFKLAPEVLGLPLASPTRRAVAMAIDLFLITLLVKTGGVFLGLAGGLLLFRASASDAQSGIVRRSVRLGLRLAGAVLLFFIVVKGWGAWRDRPPEDDDEEQTATASVDESGLDLDMSPRDMITLAGPVMALRNAEDSVQVENATVTILEKVKAGGASNAQIYELRHEMVEFMGENADSGEVHAVDRAVARVAGAAPTLETPEPVVRAYLGALERHDTNAVKAYRDTITHTFAGERIQALEQRAEREDERADSLETQLEEARKAHGVRAIIAGFADDLGVGFGWSAVYFTAFLALWRGQTPGKRAARVRVLRLDGKPLGWWLSFERFGGYAASLSVGLLGFVQILWDRNRQGLHDKACETVVVREQVRTR